VGRGAGSPRTSVELRLIWCVTSPPAALGGCFFSQCVQIMGMLIDVDKEENWR
jgi:hypothetical protein